MLTCHLMGGLGNQLFQIFTTVSYAIKSNNTFHFLNVETLGGGDSTLRYTYWNSFLVRLKPFLKEQFPKLIRVSEQGFKFNEIKIEPNKDIYLFGYFQSYKYFEDNFNTISKMIGINAFKDKVVVSCKLPVKDYVSLHFRIGDYKKVSLIHPIATYEYYKSSLSYIQSVDDKKNNILYFCEDEDIESVNQTINKLKNDFPSIVFVRADPKLTDWEQMLLMSSCSHNIIANSSFSWWAAYLNTNPDKQVCYPSVWFGETVGKNTIDLCPNNWKQIKC
jgi:hypothetical protein